MTIEIRQDDLRGVEVQELLQTHLQSMAAHSPPVSAHALDIDGLRKPDVTFWSAWRAGVLLGAGALKELDPEHGEIKSMHTVAAARGLGIGRHMLTFIVNEAKHRGYRRLSLETGSMEIFAPARALYLNNGFRLCAPFGDYAEDPYSVFMTRELS